MFRTPAAFVHFTIYLNILCSCPFQGKASEWLNMFPVSDSPFLMSSRMKMSRIEGRDGETEQICRTASQYWNSLYISSTQMSKNFCPLNFSRKKLHFGGLNVFFSESQVLKKKSCYIFCDTERDTAESTTELLAIWPRLQQLHLSSHTCKSPPIRVSVLSSCSSRCKNFLL